MSASTPLSSVVPPTLASTESLKTPVTLEEVETPLEIEDYSCANTFEQIVDDVERYLRQVFQTRPELHRFVYLRAPQGGRTAVSAHPAAPITGNKTHTKAAEEDAEEASLHSMDSSTSLESASQDGANISVEDVESLASALSCSTNAENHTPLVISRTFALQRPRRRGLSADIGAEGDKAALADDMTVEVHVYDTTHPIGVQFQLPLFFLIRSVNREVSYLPTESTFYLSILATAVGNAFCAGQQYLHGTAPSRGEADPGTVLATPFLWHRGCAPCFVPVGDCYQELFEGLAPPIAVPPSDPVLATPIRVGAHDSSSRGLVAMLIGNPVLSTSFRGEALAKIPNNCQYLSDLLDLFQLHIGRRSHVQTSEFDGICISLWKRYTLSIPWRFLPFTPAHDGKGSPAAGSAPSSNIEPPHLHERRVSDGPTWPRLLECENELHRAVCGPFTYPIGTSTPPVEQVCFSFGWSQLRELETQESARRTFLNPFAPSSTAAGQAVQRRACVRVQARVREEARYSHYVCDKVTKLTDAIFRDVRSLVTVGASESAADPTSGLTPEEMRKLVAKVLAVSDGGVSVAAQARLLERFVQTAEPECATVQDALADLLRSANAPGGPGGQGLGMTARSAAGGGLGAASSSPVKDLRGGYFPGSFLSRFAYVCGEFVERPENVLELWRVCVAWMKMRIDQGGREAIPEVLRCLALPENGAAAVDLNQTLMVQKLQLLAYCLRTMLLTPREKEKHVAELKAQEDGVRSPSKGRRLDGWDDDDDAGPSLPGSVASSSPQGNRAAGESVDDSFFDPAVSSSSSSALRLITKGETLVVPPSVPSPPMTTDTILQRAKELNDLGTGRGAELTRTWLQSDALYNDMCLFLHVNKAAQGRVVRFPDFIQWHSPRDFIALTPAQATTDDNAYLSDRMQKREDGVSHVWWALWDRATPRSLEDIAAHLFQEHEQVALVFRWLTSVVTLPTLLLEVVNASLANASHRLLSHRHVIGGSPAGGIDAATASAIPTTTTPIADLRAYLQTKCTTFTSNVEGAAAVFDAVNAAAEVSPGAIEMEVETVRTLYATAISGLGEMESAVCVAVAMENLLGAHPAGTEAALVVQQASAPRLESSTARQTLALQSGTTTFAVWASAFMPRFVLPQDRTEQEMVARLTCTAERPLNTTGCFQQLIVQKKADVLRLSLALTHEVL